MEKIVLQTLLYDVYGDLLTEHQKKIYERAVFDDMSLSEIADEAGISRQGVHDLIRRCNTLLEEYEKKLHLVEKFLAARELLDQVQKELEHLRPETLEEEKKVLLGQIRKVLEGL